MQRTIKNYFVLFLKGMAMGAADVVPGVSGGTIAFISGIYQELISSISNINIKLFETLFKEGIAAFWKKANANFLIAVLLGVFISALSVMNLMHYLLEMYPIPVWSFFFGLVLASILFVGKRIQKISYLSVLFMVISAAVAFVITKMEMVTSSDSLWYLFVSGAIAICAMILPGISGSFILVLLGSYTTVSAAVHHMEFKKLVFFFLGCIVGILSFSRLLKWLFSKFENLTLAILTGFIIGSLNKIWPWKKVLKTITINGKSHVVKEISVLPTNYEGESHVILAIVFAVLGYLLIVFMEKLASKENV